MARVATKHKQDTAAQQALARILARQPDVALLVLLRRMHYDDAIVCRNWRLEYVQPETGKPYFRLYLKDITFGIADVSLPVVLSAVQLRLANYLSWLGWCAADCQLVRSGAQTAPDARRRVDQLFPRVTLASAGIKSQQREKDESDGAARGRELERATGKWWHDLR